MILPLAAYATWFLLVRTRYNSLREALLVAAAWWTLELVILTELLSVYRAVTPGGLATGWSCGIGIQLAAFLIAVKKQRQRTVTRPSLVQRFSEWSGRDWIMVSGALLIASLVGVTAALSPPNGSDQLQYHLPRVVAWAGRHSVGFFPTHYYVQLFAPPLAEWMMLHSYVLSGGDHFVGLIQWLAFAGSAIAVSLIARELGANLRTQILAALLCVTLPQGVLAASGAKNDWILAFWLSAVVFFFLRWRSDSSLMNSCNAAICLGAALLSKGTVYPFLPPIVAAISVCCLRSKWNLAFRQAPVVLTLILLMNGPQWARNYSLHGSIFGLASPDTAGKEKYSVDRISAPGVASNVLRELAMHLITPLDSLNQRETGVVRRLVSSMGVNPDERAITNYSNFEIPHSFYYRDEYYAGNLLHLALAIFTFAALFFLWRDGLLAAATLALGIAGGFVLYCSLFKWEIWCARLHLPLFVLASAVIAVVLGQRWPKAVFPVALIALAAVIPFAVSNNTRPLLAAGGFHHPNEFRNSILFRSRPELYFTQQLMLKDSYLAAAAMMRSEKCSDVGLDTSVKPYSHEYPLIELGRNPGQELKFRYLDVHNFSSKYADPSDLPLPCLVVCPDCREHREKWDEYLPVLPEARSFGDVVVFSRTPVSPALRASQP